MDGTVVEQLAGIDYVRAANTHEPWRSAGSRRRPSVDDRSEIRHHFEMSLFGSGKAINEGFFYLARDRGRRSTCSFNRGPSQVGDMVMFPMLFLQVMAPAERDPPDYRRGARVQPESGRPARPARTSRSTARSGRSRSDRAGHRRLGPPVRGRGPPGRLPDRRRPAQAGLDGRRPDDPRTARPSAWRADRDAASPPG